MPLFYVFELERDRSMSDRALGSSRHIEFEPRLYKRDPFAPPFTAMVGLDFVTKDLNESPSVSMYKALGYCIGTEDTPIFYEVIFCYKDGVFCPFKLSTVDTYPGRRISVVNISNVAAIHNAFGTAISSDAQFVDPKQEILIGNHDIAHQISIPHRFVDVVGEAFHRSPYLKGLAYDYDSEADASLDLSGLLRLCITPHSDLESYSDRTLVTATTPVGIDPAIAVRFASNGWIKSPASYDVMGNCRIDVSKPVVIENYDNVDIRPIKPQWVSVFGPLMDIVTDFRISIRIPSLENWDQYFIVPEMFHDRYFSVRPERTHHFEQVIDGAVKSCIYGLVSLFVSAVGIVRDPSRLEITITKTFGDELLIVYALGDLAPKKWGFYLDTAARSLVTPGLTYG